MACEFIVIDLPIAHYADHNLFDLLLDLAQRNYNNIFIVDDFNYCTIDWNLRVIRSHSNSHNSKLPKRMYYNGNYILMNYFFTEFNWTLLLDALNTQECWDLFTDKVDYAIEKFIPINGEKIMQ